MRERPPGLDALGREQVPEPRGERDDDRVATQQALGGVVEHTSGDPYGVLLRLNKPGPGTATLYTIDAGFSIMAAIGFYLYDADHSYEHQLRNLRLAEPFFTDDCLVMIDDTNAEPVRRATLDFVAASGNRYETLLDVRTPRDRHPTYWNGAMLLRRVA